MLMKSLSTAFVRVFLPAHICGFVKERTCISILILVLCSFTDQRYQRNEKCLVKMKLKWTMKS